MNEWMNPDKTLWCHWSFLHQNKFWFLWSNLLCPFTFCDRNPLRRRELQQFRLRPTAGYLEQCELEQAEMIAIHHEARLLSSPILLRREKERDNWKWKKRVKEEMKIKMTRQWKKTRNEENGAYIWERKPNQTKGKERQDERWKFKQGRGEQFILKAWSQRAVTCIWGKNEIYVSSNSSARDPLIPRDPWCKYFCIYMMKLSVWET